MHGARLRPGDIVDKYEIRELIGGGSMGDVYRARHTFLGTDVALKCLRVERAEQPRFAQRMRNEARVLGRLRHPNVVTVHNAGIDEIRSVNGRRSVLWIAMEFLRGKTLRDLLLEEPSLSLRATLEVTTQVCAAMQVAHELRIAHRDLKPENIFMVDEPRRTTKVLDLGTADYFAGVQPGADEQQIGTLAYMSPEQIDGVTDARSDLYAVALIVYEALAGRHPFAPYKIFGLPAPEELLQLQRFKEPDVLPWLPEYAWRVIAKGFAKQPEGRYRGVAEFAEALASAVERCEADGGDTGSAHPPPVEATAGNWTGAVDTLPGTPTDMDSFHVSIDAEQGVTRVNTDTFEM